ncbi:hypothetical protein FRB99_008872 [Tulasnella sp. 403]|nr:hypothetical protein FRB99_008872 [Tulasnella sp. 403]
MTVFSKLVAVVTALSSAAATSSGDTMFKLSTHRPHSGPNNTTFVTYHPPTQYETFGLGIDTPKPGWIDLTGLDTDKEYYRTPRLAAFDFLEDRYGGSKSIRLHVLGPATPPYLHSPLETEPGSVTHVYFKQTLNGIEVANAVANVAVKDKKVVAYGANFVPKPKYIAPGTPKLTFSEAIVAAESRLGIKYNGEIVKKEYVITDPDTAILTYIVPVAAENDQDILDAIVDAESGRVVDVIRTHPEVEYRILEFMGPDPTGWSTVAHRGFDEDQVPFGDTESPCPTISPPSETGRVRKDMPGFYDCSDEAADCLGHFTFGMYKREHPKDDASELSYEGSFAREAEFESHSLINHLAGGGRRWCLSTTESSGMGQGWMSVDIFRRIFSLKTPQDFVIFRRTWNDTTTVRSTPYSINMTVNPHTYASVQSMDDVHHIGEVWATMLVEMYWKLVAAKGYKSPFSRTETEEPDGGNTIFKSLFINGLQTQPCNPTFLTGRDAIIQADENLYGGENKCTLWKAFAKRGLGVNAADYTNDFGVPAGC